MTASSGMDRDDGVVEGFEDPGVAGFVGEMGPIYRKLIGNRSVAGFRVRHRHCNSSGICHGGWLSTFADVQLVRQIVTELGIPGRGTRTVSLTIDFLAAAKLGDWVEGSAGLVGATRNLVFVQGQACVAGEPIIRMNGIFSLRKPEA
jgi:acyl-coenzyme A thioesterase PaaI-like protein